MNMQTDCSELLYSQTTDRKLLSIVTSGRNDNYMGNFIYRITTAINYLAYNLNKLGRLDDVEVVITDWGSDIPLSKVLSLTEEAAKICRFVYVPQALAKDIKPDGFDPSTSANVSLRRSRGEYLMIFTSDLLAPSYSLNTLLLLLEGKLGIPFDVRNMFYFVSRYQIPWEIVQREPNLEEWNQYLLLNANDHVIDRGMSGMGKCGAALMMHRDIWYSCHGFDEKLNGWGWTDIDLTLRVTQLYAWMDIAGIGVRFYHMEHNRYRTLPPQELWNPRVINSEFVVNDEKWGLVDYDLEIQEPYNVSPCIISNKSSRLNSLNKNQDVTRQEIWSDILDTTVREHVNNTLQKMGITRSTDIAANNWDYLDALAWYSLRHYPLNYIEFGIQLTYAAAIVAAASPGVQIYGIDSWQPVNGQNAAIPLEMTAGSLQKVGYCGYTRFVSGNIRTAMKRLRDSSVDNFSVDLILYRPDLFDEDSFNQLYMIIPHIKPGGAIISYSPKTTGSKVWEKIKDCFPVMMSFECNNSRMGLVSA